MLNQFAKQDYTLDQIEGIRERWIGDAIFTAILKDYQQAEFACTGKVKQFYERLYPPLVTLELMLLQRLGADPSCDEAVRARIDQLPAEQASAVSESSSGYCQARQRLPGAVVKGCLQQAARCLRQELGEAALWGGRQVGLLDGSTVRLTATAELQEHYGVSSNQHGENHWPVMRILAAFHLFSGGLEAAIEAPYTVGELSMVAELMRASDPGWVYVGDMNFGCYRTVQTAKAYQHDVVVRMRPDRVKRWIQEHPLVSGEERVVVWRGADQEREHVEPDLPISDIAGRLIYLRVARPGFRPFDLYLFTTLTDASQYPTQAILDLYGRRWNVELDLRHLKTTLALEDLHGKSVAMVCKELWVGFLAYTFIRGLMGLAALKARLSPLGLSFARCLRRIRSAAPLLTAATSPQARLDAWQTLFTRLAQCRLPVRKKPRFEPRQVWGKPRVYPTLKGSRDQARAAELAQRAASKS